VKIERSTRNAGGPWEALGTLTLHTIAVCVILLLGLGSSSARAQGLFASGTPTPTPIPGGAAAIGEPTAMSTKGAGSPGVIQHPQPTEFSVGGESVFPPNRECASLILQALGQHAPVAIPASDRPQSDQRCQEQMNRALTLERTRPECASGPCW